MKVEEIIELNDEQWESRKPKKMKEPKTAQAQAADQIKKLAK